MKIVEENDSYDIDSSILDLLLKDQTTKKNIIFGTNNYKAKGYKSTDQITSSILFRRSYVNANKNHIKIPLISPQQNLQNLFNVL